MLSHHLDLLGLPDADAAFVPPDAVAPSAAEGLRLRALWGRGGTAVGVARAEGLAAHQPLPGREMRVIAAWFARFAYLRARPGWEALPPSAGFIAWQLWGGDAGRAWVELQRADWDC